MKRVSPASKIYYLAIQDDPTDAVMDIKMFIKGAKIGLLNKGFEVESGKLKTQWQFAIVSYGADEDGVYKDITLARTRQPVSRLTIDFGKLVENIVYLTKDFVADNEIYARGYIIAPANKNMNLADLLDTRREQLRLSDADIASARALASEPPLLLTIPI